MKTGRKVSYVCVRSERVARIPSVGGLRGGEIRVDIFAVNRRGEAAVSVEPKRRSRRRAHCFRIAVGPPGFELRDRDVVWRRKELESRASPDIIERLVEESRQFVRTHSPRALLGAKQLLELIPPGQVAALARERALFVDFFRDEDRREGIRAFLERREPDFSQ